MSERFARGFKDEAREIESQGERIADGHGFGSVGQAKSTGALEQSARLDGIAGFGIGLSAGAQIPGVRTDLKITRQADGAVRESKGGGKRETERLIWSRKRAAGASDIFRSARDVRFRLVNTFVAADPFGGMAVVIMAVGRKQITIGTKWNSFLVETTLQTG